MFLGSEPSESAHLRHAQHSISQVDLRALDSRPQNILMRTKSGRFRKQRRKMVGRHFGDLGHRCQADVSTIVRVDVFEHPCKAFLSDLEPLSSVSQLNEGHSTAGGLVKCSGVGQFLRFNRSKKPVGDEKSVCSS